MRGYLREIGAFESEIRLFLYYNVMGCISFGVFQIVFNLYLLKLNMREDDIGVFTSVQTVCMGLGGFLLGYLVNRLGSWRCVTWGFLIFLISSTAISFAESRMILYFTEAFYGLGLAFLFNTTMPFVLEWSNRRNRAKAAALSFSLISLSTTLGSLVGGLLPESIGIILHNVKNDSIESYRWAMLVGTFCSAMGLIPLWLMHTPRSGARRSVEITVPEPVEDAARRQVRADLWVFVLVGGLMSIGVGMVLPFYNVYLNSLGADTRVTGIVFAISGLVAAIIGLGAPALARRLGALNAVLILRTAIIPFYGILIFIPSFPLAAMAHIVRQTTFSMAWPIDSTFIGELLPPRARSSVFGLRSGVWNVTNAAATVIGGGIIVRSGYSWTFVSIVGFTAVSAVLFTLYYRRHPLVQSGSIPAALRPRRDGDWRRPDSGSPGGSGTAVQVVS